MHPDLVHIAEEFRAAQARLHRLVKTVGSDAWSRRPDPRRWSVAECVEHLNLTGRAFLPPLERAVARARSLGAPAPRRYRRDPLGWMLWRIMGPPVRFRVPTAPSFVPDADRPREEMLAEFDRLQAEQIRLVESADGLPLQKVRVPSPFNKKVTYNTFAALSILPRHQERHIWQAAQALGRD